MSALDTLEPPPGCLSAYRISRAAAGELAAGEAAGVEAHVATCVRCRERLAAERAAVERAASEELPSALRARPTLAAVGRARTRTQRLTWVATYAVALAALVLFATRTTPEDPNAGFRAKGALKVEVAIQRAGAALGEPAALATAPALAAGDKLRLRVGRGAGLFVVVEGFDDSPGASVWVELYRGETPEDGWLPVGLEVTPGAPPRLRLAVCKEAAPTMAVDALAERPGCSFVAHTFGLVP